ncbi:hypothetical protein OU800_22820 [Pseudomonas sp. GOM7]|uniref:hypothetical protein n=1 Tax=unclassified Pseudomonas TaxID=196821 RepID=UPI00227BCABD|nr:MULTISPECIES: hypothetical protein [unclassified Pseudomonas]WAJ37402.1 hypothetical protein OU800_22820 [Pseudomonas sp. GOM7]
MPDTTPFPTVQTRRDPWQERPAAGVAYHLRTDAEAEVLCRLLGLFAQLQLLPDALQVTRRQDDLHIELQVQGLSVHRAGVLAQKLRGLVCVWEVDWRHLDHSLSSEVA